jgi:hypothetical protein
MQYIFDLHHTMMSQKLILVYQGDFTQETTKSILAMTERNIDSSGEDSAIKRKVFNVMVESLQNIVKHSDELIDGVIRNHAAIFLVGREEDRYTIMSGNPILKTHVQKLKENLERINGLDKEGLKDLYKQIIKQTALSEKGGAGLGFVDMARKSGEKLGFDFPEMSKDYCFFCLKVNVPREISTN